MEFEKLVYIPLAQVKMTAEEIERFGQHLSRTPYQRSDAIDILRSILIGNQVVGGGSFVVDLEKADVATLLQAATESGYTPMVSFLEFIHKAITAEEVRKNATDYRG